MKVTFVHILINQKGKAHSPPLGILFLMAVLRQHDVECEFRQFSHVSGTPLDPQALGELLNVDADVLAVGCMINGLPLLIMALADVRLNCPLLLGGPGFQGIGEDLLDIVPQATAVAVGEFEGAVWPAIQFLTGSGRPEDAPNLYIRSHGVVQRTGSSSRIRDLDALPFPAYDMVDLSSYQGVPAIASRGCPYECSFCDVAPAWGRRNERYSVGRVLEDLDALHDKFGVSEVGFVDDLFVLNRKWVYDFCRRKIAQRNTVRWHCTGHVNLMDAPLTDLMAEAGCASIYIGAESGSDEVLKQIRKNFDSADIVRAARTIRDSGVALSTNFLWGFPFEGVSEMVQTLSLIDELNDLGAKTSLMMLAPLASSPIYQEGRYSIEFDRNAPNVFLEDYKDLPMVLRSTFEKLIETTPRVFSAFHVFSSVNARKMNHIRRFVNMLPAVEEKINGVGAAAQSTFI